MENFSIFYNDEETNLDLVAMKDFKTKWREFDLHARVSGWVGRNSTVHGKEKREVEKLETLPSQKTDSPPTSNIYFTNQL